MKLDDWIDSNRLVQLISDKLVSARPHPSFPELIVLNYTPAAQGIPPSGWDKTLSSCRGLVYNNDTREILSFGFAKFWNYGDKRHNPELPTGIPRIFEKVDGSFLGLFFYRNKPIVYTRGSFESNQAKWAQKYIDNNLKIDNVSWSDKKFSYIFEVVIPEDKKVVDYNFSGLVLLGYTRLFDAAEFEPYRQYTWFPDGAVRMAKEYTYEDLEELQKKEIDNFEGWVATWYNRDAPAFRTKIKLERYVLLHRMYFQTTAEVIWELVKNKEDIRKHLTGADEKLIDWATDLEFNILWDKSRLEGKSKEDFRYAIEMTNIAADLEAPEKERRKAFAMYATKAENPQLLFLLYDAKFDLYEEQLWKICKPANSRFRDEGEEG